ncbi:ATP F0F1 synthase subunit alpha [Mycoplasma mycoides subsp. capri]|uniref:MSC_0619 family F1-like ATPase alpha subunit n=1 Tax=Mycoplasma mycoides TaxID=2102 RepID=UPI00223EB873|nr:ATP F0F1 synthase subunit alpha [Mycoplasma mycoides]QVJ95976.1 ATP F0F1 synthase subunit alpha [Mycoplasma mycoides subsp. capri]QVJ96868.1 ATP F0F1 synthase subunit alpha [Mycoplasma mycoides subsp. capri]QVJ99910.1 ATP F0F1 synthase subunit alpha [Mycoplasma mycoides subsp. capri]QVK00732.1 ATP F0F1 synthase subunit alpha [Mycoplasma mycoides subsp. capri]
MNIKTNSKHTSPKISAIYDYIVEVKGEFDYKQQQIFTSKKNKEARLFLISATSDTAYLLANLQALKLTINDELELLDNTNEIFTSNEYFGKVIDIYGNIILPEPKTVVKKAEDISSEVFKLSHDLMKVQRLNEQLYTGLAAIDLLIPIGKGQRELIVGDRQTGKTHIALNTIINQSARNIKCIYVAIGQKKESISRIYNILAQHDALKNTIILDAPANSSYEQYLAPYIGMTHAENISNTDDVLIIFDDLTKHANIFREIALLSNRPVGKEAMPGDMFFAHSQLLERAGSYKNKKTITALPIIQTIDNDITSLIASNVISITDGQIVTSSKLFSQGILPAVDIDFSVSRTGGSVQDKTIRQIAGQINKTYRKYKRQLKLSMLDYNLNSETADLMYKGKMIDKLFTSKGFSIFSYNFILMMTKIINWSLIKDIKDEQKALKFIDELINKSADGKKQFEIIKSGNNYDDKMMKNYFLFALKQYSDYVGLNWEIDNEYDFLSLDQSFLEKTAKKLGDK